VKKFFHRTGPLARIYSERVAPLFIAIAGLAALLTYLLWPVDLAQNPPQQFAAADGQQPGVANPFGRGAQVAVQLDQQLPVNPKPPLSLEHTSLAGTQPDGDWGVDAQGQLKVSRALRRRFDYYLSLIGERPLVEIQALVLQAAKQSLQEPSLGQVMALWERYVRLQQHPWKHTVDLNQPTSWSAALSERQIVRRQILGADVAYAFFSEEEGELQQMLMHVQTGQAMSNTTPPTSAPLHPNAREREAAVQEQWQQWEQRLNAAREKIEQLRQAPELSAVQREHAIEAYLVSHFQSDELLRARALLGR
jgi:lipase chaperone LimK